MLILPVKAIIFHRLIGRKKSGLMDAEAGGTVVFMCVCMSMYARWDGLLAESRAHKVATDLHLSGQLGNFSYYMKSNFRSYAGHVVLLV
jgi:hypothetical protein